jgi:hypothetical protein
VESALHEGRIRERIDVKPDASYARLIGRTYEAEPRSLTEAVGTENLIQRLWSVMKKDGFDKMMLMAFNIEAHAKSFETKQTLDLALRKLADEAAEGTFTNRQKARISMYRDDLRKSAVGESAEELREGDEIQPEQLPPDRLALVKKVWGKVEYDYAWESIHGYILTFNDPHGMGGGRPRFAKADLKKLTSNKNFRWLEGEAGGKIVIGF